MPFMGMPLLAVYMIYVFLIKRAANSQILRIHRTFFESTPKSKQRQLCVELRQLRDVAEAVFRVVEDPALFTFRVK